MLSGILHTYPGKVQQVVINPFKMKQHMPLLLYFGVMGVEDVRCSALTAEELPETFPSLSLLIQFPKAMPWLKQQQGRGWKRPQLVSCVWRGKSLHCKKWNKCCFSLGGGLLHIDFMCNVLQIDFPPPRSCFYGLYFVIASKAGHDAKAPCCFQWLPLVFVF